MTNRNGFTTHTSNIPDMLGFAADATPSADEWLAAFTADFVRYPAAEHGARALMSGLRFYTAGFVAEIAALPPVSARQPALVGKDLCAVYTATGPIIADVYQNLIRHNAPRDDIQDAFAQSMPGLIGHYQRSNR
jgi:hypothetical protein